MKIYGWLFVGLAPAWVDGLLQRLTEPPLIPQRLFPLVVGVPFVASSWLVVRRYETIERRRIARGSRVFLVLLSLVVGLPAIATMAIGK